MSLYYEAAAIINNEEKVGGSLKSRIYGKQDLKSKPAQVFALIVEAAKWSGVLKGVVERSGLLGEERKVCYTHLFDLSAPYLDIYTISVHLLSVRTEAH